MSKPSPNVSNINFFFLNFKSYKFQLILDVDFLNSA